MYKVLVFGYNEFYPCGAIEDLNTHFRTDEYSPWQVLRAIAESIPDRTNPKIYLPDYVDVIVVNMNNEYGDIDTYRYEFHADNEKPCAMPFVAYLDAQLDTFTHWSLEPR